MKTPVGLLSALLCLPLVLSGCAGGSSGSSTTTPVVPVTPAVVPPTVASVSPATVSAGAPATTLTITGTGFLASTTVQLGSTVDTTTYVSSTQLTVAVPATQLATGAILNVIAMNGTVSSAAGAVVSLEVDNPVPAITQNLPGSFLVGAPATTLSVTGTGFVPSTVLQVNGSARATAFVSATQANVTLTAADLATPGTLSLTAVNPSPAGGSSAAASIPVNNPAPGSITVAPATVAAGTPSPTTVTVTGTGFVPSSTVMLGACGPCDYLRQRHATHLPTQRRRPGIRGQTRAYRRQPRARRWHFEPGDP